MMHDIYAPTADAAQVLIPELTNRGYQLVTVSELAAFRGGWPLDMCTASSGLKNSMIENPGEFVSGIFLKSHNNSENRIFLLILFIQTDTINLQNISCFDLCVGHSSMKQF